MAALIYNQWTYLADPPVWGAEFHTTVNDHLVLIGGGQDQCKFGDGGRYFDPEPPTGLQVHAYDFVLNAWYELKPRGTLPPNREHAACAAVGDVVVLAGGVLEDAQADDDIDDRYEITATVLALKLKDDLRCKWSTFPPMPHAVSGATAFVLDGNLYVAGGYTKGWWERRSSETASNVVQMLDLAAGKWSIRAPLPLTFAGGAVHSGRYFGITLNDDDVPTIYSYHPGTDTWMLQRPLAEPVPSMLRGNQYHRGLSVSSSPDGLQVLGNSSGTAAMLCIVDSKVVSARWICDENWCERISMFAQDWRLTGLQSASFELSAHCKPVLLGWARAWGAYLGH